MTTELALAFHRAALATISPSVPLEEAKRLIEEFGELLLADKEARL